MSKTPSPVFTKQSITSTLRDILKKLDTLYRESESLRQSFLKQIETHQIPHTDNIRHPDLWIVYPFFTTLLGKLYPDKDISILDWGGLYGHVTALLNKMGYTASNYLLNLPENYEIFQSAFQLATIFGKDPNRLSLPDTSCDVVISSGVLEHVRDDRLGDENLILKEIARVLKPGGTFWIWYLPSRYSLSEALSRLTERWCHTYLFDKYQITSLLQQNGFQVLFLARHGFLPGTLKRGVLHFCSLSSLFRLDMALANFPGLRTLGANFFVIARKPSPETGIPPAS